MIKRKEKGLRGKYIVDQQKDVNVKEWSEDISKFINNILRPIIRDNSKRKEYTSPKAMKVWKSAFTHPGFDKRQGSNYEELEFIGDRALKYAFNKYTMSRFPEYDKEELSNMETSYMSKEYQPKFGKELGLDKYTRILRKDVQDKVLEDLYESFIGALDVVSDNIQAGLGIVNVRNFVTWFFNKKSLEMTAETLGGIVITQVKQIFERFDKRAVRDGKDAIMDEWITEADGNKTLRVKVTPGIRDILSNKFQIDFREDYLGQATGRDKKAVTIEAYRNALLNLRSYGIDPESAKLLKQLHDFAQPELLPYRFNLLRKLKEDGYIRAYFEKPKFLRTDQSLTITFMVENEKRKSYQIGKIDVDTTFPGETLEIEAKAQLIRNYIGIDIEEAEKETKGKERVEIIEKDVTRAPSKDERKAELVKLKVPELRDRLRKLNLKVGGRKAELVERLLDREFEEQ